MGGLANWVPRAIGTITVRSIVVSRSYHTVYLARADGEIVCTTFVEKRRRPQRFIKVSHHGYSCQRWRPFSEIWWKRNVGPIPPGYRVYHRDGNSMNDDPSNLRLVKEGRLAIILASNPAIAARQKQRKSKAVSKTNRQRAAVRWAQIQPDAWYAIVQEERLIVMRPYRTEGTARRRFPKLAAAFPFLEGKKWFPATGEEIRRNQRPDGILEDFKRFIPNLDDDTDSG